MLRIGLGCGLGVGGPRVWTPSRLPSSTLLRWASGRALTQFASGTTAGSGAVTSGNTAGRWADLAAAADAFTQPTAGVRPVLKTHPKGRGVAVHGTGGTGAGGAFLAGAASVSTLRYLYAVATVIGPDVTRGAGPAPVGLFNDNYHALAGTAPITTGAVLMTGFQGTNNLGAYSLAGYTRDGTAISTAAADVGYGRRRVVLRVQHTTSPDAGVLNLLRHVGFDGFYWRGCLHEVIALTSAASAGDLAKIDTYLQRYWLGGALVVVTGDSLMAGYNLLESQGPAALLHEAYNRCVSVPVIAVPGQGVTSSISPLTDTLATTDPAKLSALKFSHSPAVVVALCGTNDLANGRTAVQLRADLIAYCAAVQAAGWKVVVGTIAPRTKDTDGITAWPAGKETERVAFNTALRASHVFADGFVDVDVIAPTLAADGVHWTSAGTAAVVTGTGGVKDATDALLP